MKPVTTVIKYGGHAMDIPELCNAFGQNLLSLTKKGMRFAITHGGGPQINDLLKRLRIQSHFVDGLRVTDEATLEVVEMVLCGKVNKAVVRQLAKIGVQAAGISGEDASLFMAAQKNPALGKVGEITKVNPAIVKTLMDSGFVPVIAPLALDATGQPLNINADTAAGALAGALAADHFILISDVPGVLDKNGSLIPGLRINQIEELRESGVISGGMLPKLEACAHALRCGCRASLILDGREPNSLARFLIDGTAQGTKILAS